MSELKLAANYVDITDFPSEWASFADSGHLQIVYDNGFTQQEIEVQAPYQLEFAHEFPSFAYPGFPRDHTNLDNTPNYGDHPNKYRIVSINVGNRDVDDIWELLQIIHIQFQITSPDFFYWTDQNSNSYAATLLWMVGIDEAEISSYVASVKPDDVSGFPGVDRNILTDGYTFTGAPIDYYVGLTLQTTDGDDILNTGRGDDTIFGSLGSDIFDAGDQFGDGDTLSYEKLTTGVHLSVGTTGTPTTYQIADIAGGATPAWTDAAKNFEFYTLSPASDLFELSILPGDIYGLTFDGGGNTNNQDFIVQHYLNANNTVNTILADMDILSLEGLAPAGSALRGRRSAPNRGYSAFRAASAAEIVPSSR